MGTYVNPGNAGFSQINDSDYVDNEGGYYSVLRNEKDKETGEWWF